MDSEAPEARRLELANMLDIARGRLAEQVTQTEAASRLVAQIEGGLVETDAWISKAENIAAVPSDG